MEQLNHKGTKDTKDNYHLHVLVPLWLIKALQVTRIERVALANVSGLVAFLKPA
jgi:hypothetical protein